MEIMALIVEDWIMTKLPYLRTMFATCMVFQVIFALCVLLWFVDPNLKGHYLLPAIFPNFTFLTIGSFIYGLIASGVGGRVVASDFLFFSNLLPTLAVALLGQTPMKTTALKG
jgi:hypothetical protein